MTLVVDDDTLRCQMVELALRDEGHDAPSPTDSGAAAAGRVPPCPAIAALAMPGLDGAGPIAERCRNGVAATLLAKPSDMDAFCATAARVLRA